MECYLDRGMLIRILWNILIRQIVVSRCASLSGDVCRRVCRERNRGICPDFEIYYLSYIYPVVWEKDVPTEPLK